MLLFAFSIKKRVVLTPILLQNLPATEITICSGAIFHVISIPGYFVRVNNFNLFETRSLIFNVLAFRPLQQKYVTEKRRNLIFR